MRIDRRRGRAPLMDNPYAPPKTENGPVASDEDFPFHINCECGCRIGINVGMAGSQIDCRCKRIISVPRLSELRKAVGKNAYGDDPVLIIESLLKSYGSLPSGSCAHCGCATSQKICFIAECERPRVKKPSPVRHLLALISLPLWALLVSKETQREVRGREITVGIAVTLCDACSRSLNLRKRSVLRELVNKVPIYHRLLQEYPQTTLHQKP